MKKIICQSCNGNGYTMVRVGRVLREPVETEETESVSLPNAKIITIERVTKLCEVCQGEGLIRQRL